MKELSYFSQDIKQPCMINSIWHSQIFRKPHFSVVLTNGLDIKLGDVQYMYFHVHSFCISADSLVLHCDERVVWSVDGILEYLCLSVQLEGHLVVGRQFLPRLCDLIKVEL